MRIFLFSFLLFLSQHSFAQEEIFLKNPSFEDFPKLSHTPKSWYNCGFVGKSEPDTHPVPNGEFQVDKTPYDCLLYTSPSPRDS